MMGCASWNLGIRNDQTWRGEDMSGKQKQACCRRMFNGLKCLVIWILIPV